MAKYKKNSGKVFFCNEEFVILNKRIIPYEAKKLMAIKDIIKWSPEYSSKFRRYSEKGNINANIDHHIFLSSLYRIAKPNIAMKEIKLNDFP